MTDNSPTIKRPRWIELQRLTDKPACNAAAERLFGFQPPRPGERPQPYGAAEFQQRFGIDIQACSNFLAETGQANAPTGPLTPASERLPIEPILVIQQDGDQYRVQGLHSSIGFYNRDKTMAWIPVDEFMDLMGDDYFAHMEQELQQHRQDLLGRVKALQLTGLDEAETAVFQKVRAGCLFEDLDEQERRAIAKLMQRSMESK